MTGGLDHHIDLVAKALLGDPNPRHSNGREWRYGTNGSLKIDLVNNVWHDHEAKVGGGVIDLVRRQKECDAKAAAEWLRSELHMDDTTSARRHVETFSYVDEQGEEIFRVLRYEPKDFRQCRPDGTWSVKGCRPLIYRLPEVSEAIATGYPVVVVEGERKANLLWDWFVPATCNPGGSGKWRAEHAEFLRGADVAILPDNDDAGRKHAEAVARSLIGIARRIRVVTLPDLKAKGDVVNWAKAGGTREQLDVLIQKAPEWKAPSEGVTQDKDIPLKEPPNGNDRKGNWRKSGINVKEIRTMKFDPITFLVPGLIPSEGVTLLASKPKKGKSWLLLDLALAATMNRGTLGDITRKPAQGDVLYLALEDSYRRIQSRCDKLLGYAFAGDWPEHLRVNLEWRRMDQGGLEDIREWVGEVRAAGRSVAFVAIDVFQCVRQPGDSKKAYEGDYASMSMVAALARELKIAIIVAHHTRKQGSEDPMDLISGTMGLVAAADTIIVIGSSPTGTIFHVKGRDVEASDLSVEFNKSNCKWTILGDADAIRQTNTKSKILDALREAAGEPLTPTDITRITGLKGNTVLGTLRRMAGNQEIRRSERGKYALL